jgi:hypothetical protein
VIGDEQRWTIARVTILLTEGRGVIRCLRDLSRLTSRRVDNNKNDMRNAAQARDEEEEERGERDRKTKQPASFRV